MVRVRCIDVIDRRLEEERLGKGKARPKQAWDDGQDEIGEEGSERSLDETVARSAVI